MFKCSLDRKIKMKYIVLNVFIDELEFILNKYAMNDWILVQIDSRPDDSYKIIMEKEA